jgi:hypothetical protein
VARQAEGRGIFVFRQDKVGNGRMVRFVAGEAGDGRGILAKGDVRARDWMSLDGVVDLVTFVEVEVEPRIHFLEWDCGAPRESEGVGLPIHLHETSDVASHADVLRRGVQMRRKITGVGRVAKAAVALLVRGVLDRVRGETVARDAELIGGRRETDVRGALHVSDRVANGAAHRYGGVDVLPGCLVFVAFETFRGIEVSWQNDGMLVKVGTRRRSGKQQDESNHERGEKKKPVARVRERHRSPFAESEDFVYPGERRRLQV